MNRRSWLGRALGFLGLARAGKVEAGDVSNWTFPIGEAVKTSGKWGLNLGAD